MTDFFAVIDQETRKVSATFREEHAALVYADRSTRLASWYCLFVVVPCIDLQLASEEAAQ